MKCSHDQHARVLSSIGLEPECDDQGQWTGYDACRTSPLEDPEHVFNSAEWRPVEEGALQQWAQRDTLTAVQQG